MTDLLRGLRFFENLRVVHYDLKPANILISSSLRLIIGDFGLMKSIDQRSAGPLGTYRFTAPELFAGETADFKSDVFSVGMILYELLALHHPFIITNEEQGNYNLHVANEATNRRAWREIILNRPLLPLHSHLCEVAPPATALIEEMLKKKRAERPLASQLLTSAFLIKNVPELQHREQFVKQARLESKMAQIEEENEVLTLYFLLVSI